MLPFASLLLLALACLFITRSYAYGETAEEAADRARSLLRDEHVFGVGTLSSVFSQDYADESLRGHVAAGAEYFAPCFANGDLAMLAMPVSQTWRNALQTDTQNATFSVTSPVDPRIPDPRHSHKDRWTPDRPHWRRGMPSKQRITLFGHLQRIEDAKAQRLVQRCFTRAHPDALHWAPGSPDSPHVAFWVRFIVDKIYRVGGFGDESAIGWVDVDLFRNGNSFDSIRLELKEERFEHSGSPVSVERLFGQNDDWTDERPPAFVIQ